MLFSYGSPPTSIAKSVVYQASATKNAVCLDIYLGYNPGFEIFVLLENWEDGDTYYHPSYLKISD